MYYLNDANASSYQVVFGDQRMIAFKSLVCSLDFILILKYINFSFSITIFFKSLQQCNSIHSQIFLDNFNQCSLYIFYKYKQMGQCEVCTTELEYNLVDYSLALKDITQTDLAKDIQKLKKDNQQYVKDLKTIPLSNNTYYKGKLADSKKQGYGQLYCDEFNYFGFFKDDLPHGTGALITQKQCQYGQFQQGCLNGAGKEWTVKYQFEGNYSSGERIQGNLSRDQLTYTGTFQNNLYEGKGTLNLKDGTIYTGSFKQGKFQDKGVLTLPNGNSYMGGFKQGKYDGYGQFIWKNGNSYKGQYANGERQGYGVLIIGKIQYAGHWKNNARNGRGLLSQGNEQVSGDWKNDMLVDE